MGQRPTQTTTAGIPVGDNQNSITAGPRGPLLVQDWQLLRKWRSSTASACRSGWVHAKGSGAHGTFTVTGDIARYSKASVFAMGQQADRLPRALLDRRRRAWCCRCRARRPRLRVQVLYRPGQLGPGRQQHAGVLRPRPVQVQRLHPHPEARSQTTKPRRWSARTARAPTATASAPTNQQLPVNRPKVPVHTYHRDGQQRFDDSFGGAVNYEPNSCDGPVQDPHFVERPCASTAMRRATTTASATTTTPSRATCSA